jgi:glycosyltransferase involved in cell wall biosynthesis
LINHHKPLVSYVLPAFNEEAVVEAHLDELYRYAKGLTAYPFEIIVVDDGSSDRTGLLADAFAASHPGVTALHHLTNRGLTGALQTGIAHARGDLILTLDLDLSYAPYHIGLMLRALEQTNAAIVLASPYMRGGQVRNVPWLRRELSLWANRYLSIAAGGALATSTCMVRAYNAAALRKLALEPADADYNHKTLFAALRQGLPIREIPARLEWRLSPYADQPRRSSMKLLSHAWDVVASGMRHRPLMWLAIPGLIPGLLPLVAAILVATRSPARIATETIATVVFIQIASMAFAAILAGQSLRRLHAPARRRSSLADPRTESRAQSS